MSKQNQHLTGVRTELQLRLGWRKLLIFLIVLVGLYVVLPQLKQFHDTLTLLKQAPLTWIMVAFAAIMSTYIFSAIIYLLLATKRLYFYRTLGAVMASSFANRILPAGTGAISISYLYLRRQKLSLSQAGAVVAANNFIGLIGHSILLALLILSSRTHQLHLLRLQTASYWLVVISVVVSLAIAIIFKHIRRALIKDAVHIFKQLALYRAHPLKIVGALIFSMMLTGAHVICFWACAHGLGVSIHLYEVLLILTAGLLLATLIPAPGGLGANEAGLFAGLATFGTPTAQSLAIVLLYRLFSYWLTFAVGAGAFEIIELRGDI